MSGWITKARGSGWTQEYACTSCGHKDIYYFFRWPVVSMFDKFWCSKCRHMKLDYSSRDLIEGSDEFKREKAKYDAGCRSVEY